MKNIEEMKRELMSSGKASELKKFAGSPEAARLSQSVDKEALKKAAASGDSEALGKMLTQILSTPDGQALAKRVSETFGKK